MSSSASASAQDTAPTYLDRHPAFLPLLIAGIFALVGAGLLPYDYYVFLRCVLTITAVFIVVHAIRSERLGWLALGIPIFILWAPAAWVILPRAAWEVLDVVVAGLVILAGVLIPAPKGATTDEKSVTRWQWWKVALLVYGIGAFACSVTVYSTGSGNPDCIVQYDRAGSYCE